MYEFLIISAKKIIMGECLTSGVRIKKCCLLNKQMQSSCNSQLHGIIKRPQVANHVLITATILHYITAAFLLYAWRGIL
jgi:hypothetical protein